MKNHRLPPLVVLVALAVAGCDRKADKPPAPKTADVPSPAVAASTADRHDDLIAWRRGDVDAAFAEARAAPSATARD